MDTDRKHLAKIKILDILRRLQSLAPYREFDLTKVGLTHIREGFLEGRAIQRVIIVLRSRGCSWALRGGGGCTMCGHFAATTRDKEIPASVYVNQFLNEFRRHNWKKYSMLCLYNSGSFLNDHEVSPEARRRILDLIAQEKAIRAVILESRPEYINNDIASEIREILSGKHVEIGIGLETSNDNVRDLCINKSFTLSSFTKAVQILKKNDLKVLSYVLVKPPFLTESEAIEDAVSSANKAFELGVDFVSLEPVSVQPYTLVQFLYEGKKYRPPWIWSVVEVAKATLRNGFIRIGVPPEFFPIPLTFAHNCEKCDPKVISAIREFNKSYDPSFLEDISCSCQIHWKESLMQGIPHYMGEGILEDRIINTLDSFDQEMIFEKIKRERLHG